MAPVQVLKSCTPGDRQTHPKLSTEPAGYMCTVGPPTIPAALNPKAHSP